MFRQLALSAFLACLTASAQDTQFLPEIDTHLTLNRSLRTYLQAKDDREGGDPEQFTFGPSLQFYNKPLVKLQHVTLFDLDDTKARAFILESGYRIVTAPSVSPENRATEAATFNVLLGAGFLASDRNRADLDWQNGDFSWRYRNKLTLQRTVSIRSYHWTPYMAAEPFYESNYSKWSTTDLYVGGLLPVGKHVQFNAYYEHENDTGKSPNKQNHYLGLTLSLYFSLKSDLRPASQRTNVDTRSR